MFSIVLKWIPKWTVAALALVERPSLDPANLLTRCPRCPHPARKWEIKPSHNCLELENLPEMKRKYRKIHFKCPSLHVFFSMTPGSFLIWWDKTRVPFCPQNWAGVGIIHKNHLTGTFFFSDSRFFHKPHWQSKEIPIPNNQFGVRWGHGSRCILWPWMFSLGVQLVEPT